MEAGHWSGGQALACGKEELWPRVWSWSVWMVRGRVCAAGVGGSGDAALHRDRLKIVHVLPRYEYDIPFYPPGRWAAAETDGWRSWRRPWRLPGRFFHRWRDAHAVGGSSVAAGVGAGPRGGGRCAGVGFHGLRCWGRPAGTWPGMRRVRWWWCGMSRVSAHHEIVVGVDGASRPPRAGVAFEEEVGAEARLLVVHAWQLPARRTEPPLLDEVNPEEVAQEQGGCWTRRWQSVQPISRRRLSARFGEDHHPAHVLVEASDRAHLVVVGSRGRGGFHGLALGRLAMPCCTTRCARWRWHVRVLEPTRLWRGAPYLSPECARPCGCCGGRWLTTMNPWASVGRGAPVQCRRAHRASI